MIICRYYGRHRRGQTGATCPSDVYRQIVQVETAKSRKIRCRFATGHILCWRRPPVVCSQRRRHGPTHSRYSNGKFFILNMSSCTYFQLLFCLIVCFFFGFFFGFFLVFKNICFLFSFSHFSFFFFLF